MGLEHEAESNCRVVVRTRELHAHAGRHKYATRKPDVVSIVGANNEERSHQEGADCFKHQDGHALLHSDCHRLFVHKGLLSVRLFFSLRSIDGATHRDL